MICRVVVAAMLAAAVTAQEVTMPEEVVFGASFELSVVSSTPFDPATLAPLVVEVLARERRGGGERLRLRARCYETGDVSLSLRPPRVLRVTTTLPDPAGPLEWPSDGYDLGAAGPSRWLLASVTSASMIAVYLGWLWRRRRSSAGARAAQESPWSASSALASVQPDRLGQEAALAELKAIVRRFCGQRYGLRAEFRTSEELVGALNSRRDELSPCLIGIDHALFGPSPIAPELFERSRALAIAFVEAAEERS